MYVKIKESITNLKMHYNRLDESVVFLRDKIHAAYGKKVINDLDKLFKTTSSNEITTALTVFLAKNWRLIQGTLLSYTATPTLDVTKLLCTVAEIVAQETKGNPLTLLIPEVCIEHLGNKFPDLVPKDDFSLSRIISTHILSTDNRSLLPVSLLLKTTLSPEPEKLTKPYYDYHHHDDPFVSPVEYERLTNHSSLTQALVEAKKDYVRMSSDDSHLLGHLTQLCQQLGLNSAYGGLGTQENAASGAYPAIIAFMNYYNGLSESEKQRIPEQLNKEIVLLLTLGSNPSMNIDATQTMDTCIATRRTHLVTAMREQAPLLSSISINGTHKEKLIAAAKTHFERTQKALDEALKSNKDTQGFDKLGISSRLLKELGIKLRINCFNELAIIRDLSVAEIKEVCEDPILRTDIIVHMKNLENLVMFVIDTLPEKLQAFLMSMSNDLDFSQEFIKSPQDLSALLIALDVEKIEVVCTAMKKALPGIIKSGRDFSLVLEYLTAEQRTAVCTAMKEALPGIIKSGRDFGQALRYLTAEQRTVVCTNLVPGHQADWGGIESLLPRQRETQDKLRAVQYQIYRLQTSVDSKQVDTLLIQTIKVLKGELPPAEYQKLGEKMKGASSPALHILGILMIALAIVLAAVAVVVAPNIVVAAAGAASSALVGAGFFRINRPIGLAKAVDELGHGFVAQPIN
ncbi:MAG: hypothetical protein NT128_00080 [Proteobacteria bacterium]|nr:hypothetical protein [Pseudomonadota bacterium]